MQYFENNLPCDHTLWAKLKNDANKLKNMGVTAVWCPPAYKGADGVTDNGYKVYDSYDLGEFNQKGSVPTKYGTKEEYLEAIKALHDKSIQVYADIVVNRRYGADAVEYISGKEFNENSRNQMVGEEKVICGYTKFTFSGRKTKYSKKKYNWMDFNGIDWNPELEINDEKSDYVMSNELDFDNMEVVEEIEKWGEWYLKVTGVDGFRLDDIKRIGHYFYRDWLPKISEVAEKPMFYMGDYWHWDVSRLNRYIENTKQTMSLLDVPLHYKLHDASKSHGNYDMKTILDGTLVQSNPLRAVTFVDNHITVPGEIKQSMVEEWFKGHAYALILLRESGYPCVFYGDYYGMPSHKMKPMKKMLDQLMKLRKKNAYGVTHDYFDDSSVIGWTREGDADHKDSGLAVVMSDGISGTKRMYIGRNFAGSHFIDALGNAKYNIKIDDEGFGEFYCNRASVSVWIKINPSLRRKVD